MDMNSQYYRLRAVIERRLRVAFGWARTFRYRLSAVVIGSRCFFEKGVTFLYGWRTRFGRNCIVDASAQFKCPTTVNTDIRYNIDISDNVFVGRGTIIDSNLSVRIGRDTFIAPYCFITDTHPKFRDSETPIKIQVCNYKAVEIGEDVGIGAHLVVIAGVPSAMAA